MSAIARVDTATVVLPLPAPLQLGAMTVTRREYTAVRVTAGDGTTGVAYCRSREAPMAEIVERLVAPHAVGADADIAIWDPETRRVVRVEDQHDAMDYSPFEGMELTGVPVHVMNRGETVVEDGRLVATRGRGRFVARAPSGTGRMAGHRAPEFAAARGWGVEIAP
mgnify:CR=1 FL=1